MRDRSAFGDLHGTHQKGRTGAGAATRNPFKVSSSRHGLGDTLPAKEAAGMSETLLWAVVSVPIVATIVIAGCVMAAPRRNSSTSIDLLKPDSRVDPTSRRPELL